MRPNAAAHQSALALPCATQAADLRTYDVRTDVRSGKAPVAGQAIASDFWGNRVRVTAPTNGMGHVGFAGIVPGPRTWSPPI